MTRSAFALVCLTLSACGGGGGGSAAIDCAAFCTSMVACDPSETQADCEARCQEMSGAVRAEVGPQVEACADVACADQNTCLQNAMSDCSGDYSGVLEAVCQKQIDCGAETDIPTCVATLQSQGDMSALGCFTDAALNALAGCAESAACATYDTDFPACVEQETGISFGS